MHGPNPDPSAPQPQRSPPTRSSILDAKSLFVGAMVENLRKRMAAPAQACVAQLARHSVLTGNDLSKFVDTLAHPSETAELIRAFSALTKHAVTADFAQVLPAFLKLAEKCLTECSEVDGHTARRVARVLDSLLEERVNSEAVGEVIDVVVGDGERWLLNRILTQADYDRPGFWAFAELFGSVFPEIETLDGIFSALKRRGPGPYSKRDLQGVRGCLWTISAQEFAATFNYVAQVLVGPDWKDDHATKLALSKGLCIGSVGDLPDLVRFLTSDEDSVVLLACRVCATMEEDEDIDLRPEARAYLSERLQDVCRRAAAAGSRSPFCEEPLLAVACISPDRSMIEEVGAIVRARLQRGEHLSSELVMASLLSNNTCIRKQ